MKQFLTKIAAYFFITLAMMTVLDFVYTKIYATATPRSKFQYLKSLSNSKIDVAFLGSSRVDNFIVPELIERQTGKKAANLGFQASKPNDIYTILKLLKEYNIETDQVFVQLDYIYNTQGHSNMMEFEMVPFIRDNGTTRHNFDYRDDRLALYYVPFYRYATFDYKIGIREVFMNAINKPTHIVKNRGYHALTGIDGGGRSSLPETIADGNPQVDSISAFANQNRLRLDYFFSPVHPKVTHRDFVAKLQTKVPGLIDYSDAVQDNSDFANYFHLNDDGAQAFTRGFLQEQLKK